MQHELETELRAKLISGAKWATVIRILSQLVTWGVTLAMVRLLTPRDYGLNAMIEVPVELLGLFCTLGIDSAIIRLNKREPEQLASAFGLLLLVNGAIFLMLVLTADQLAAYFNEPRLTGLIQAISLVFVLSPFRTIPNALLDIALDFKLKSQVELAASIISSLLALGLAYLGFGVWALVGAFLSNALLRAGLLAYFRPWIIRPMLRWAPVQELLKYGVIITLGAAIGMLAGKVVNVLTGPILGAEVLGFYAVALVFSQLPMNKVMPILQQTMFPAFAKLKGQREMAKVYLLKSLQLSAFVIFPINIGMVCVSDHMVSVIFGPKWEIITLPMAILAGLSPLRLINQIFFSPLNAVGKPNIVFTFQVISLVIFAAGSLPAARFGLMGLVGLSSFALVVGTAISVAVGGRVFKVGVADLLRAVWPALSASLMMAAVLITIRMAYPEDSGLLRLVFDVTVGCAVYVLSVRIFFRPNFDEIRKHLVSHKAGAERQRIGTRQVAMQMTKHAVLYCAKYLGLFHLSRWLTRRGLRILCYHAFSLDDEHLFRPKLFMTPNTFRQRMNTVARMGFKVIPLGEAVAALKNGVTLSNALVITIDDGWQSTVEVAAPRLAEHGFPWTLYLTTYYAEKQTQLPNIAIFYITWKTSLTKIDLRALNVGIDETINLNTESERNALAVTLLKSAEQLPTAKGRQEFVRRLAALLQIEQSKMEHEHMLHIMSIDAARQLHQSGVDIQLHTHRHSLGDGNKAKIVREIEDNRRLISCAGNDHATHLCYPSGYYNKNYFAALNACGIESAVTCNPGLNFRSVNLLELKRFLDGENISEIAFEAELSGFSEIARTVRNALGYGLADGVEP